jgi:hypothetical protein
LSGTPLIHGDSCDPNHPPQLMPKLSSASDFEYAKIIQTMVRKASILKLESEPIIHEWMPEMTTSNELVLKNSDLKKLLRKKH